MKPVSISMVGFFGQEIKLQSFFLLRHRAIRWGNNFMLFAGWEVRVVKKCDRGLENRSLSPRSQFFTQTDPNPVNNLFIFSSLSLSNHFYNC